MGALRAMLNLFRRAPRQPSCATMKPPLVKAVPGRDEQLRDLVKAKQANDRAALGLVITSGRAMAAESSVQAMLRGMLQEVDRGQARNDRH